MLIDKYFALINKSRKTSKSSRFSGNLSNPKVTNIVIGVAALVALKYMSGRQ